MKKLIINKVILKNISVYKKAEFIFSEDVNVIIGENGYGKSTLYKALKIGLYGEKSSKKYNRLQEFNDNLNKIIRNNKIEAKIEIHLTLKQTNYIVVRNLFKKSNKVSFKTSILFSDGIELSKKQKIIFDELYKELVYASDLDFFFLDGEKINEKLKSEKEYQSWIKSNIETYFNIFQYNKLLSLFETIEQNEWKHSNDLKNKKEKETLHDLTILIEKEEKLIQIEKNNIKKTKQKFNKIQREIDLNLNIYGYQIQDFMNENEINEEELSYMIIKNNIEQINDKIDKNIIDAVNKYLKKDYSNQIYENPVTLLERTIDIKSKLSLLKNKKVSETILNIPEEELSKLLTLKNEYLKLEREISNLNVSIDKISNTLIELRTEKIKIDNFIHEEYKKNTILKKNIEKYKNTIELQKNIATQNIKKMFESFNMEIKKFFANYSVTYKEGKIELFENKNKHSWENISAGEKQVITNMLLKFIWDHTDFSSTIYYDTPMGRLDTRNKNLLTKLFFNEVNSQLIIFSTDEELTIERRSNFNKVNVMHLNKNRNKNETEVYYDSAR